MKKEWKKPQLELLDISETMANWHGDSWDGFFIGRKYKPEEPGPDPIDS
ncbi:paeninodin family lasso peptide [Fredinandcohnia quinoae]|uniref:Paeninodin family lasso peptide n=1 Tax=Fredinandcohnia quinoae TaxID=2918902 RepID=A0AAW5EBX5_9BACI|nr:paeninodin family lasso peptide [Fredinandcohnia sp. SECRCQ15]MCH1626274.1 paeninodin family lasso peptide [Fredinandcohnia sp. SECRCQ15]